jgi:hypothetical protein
MSKQTRYKTKIKEVNKKYLQEAISLMLKELNIKTLNTRTFEVYDTTIRVKGIGIYDQNAQYPMDMFINEKNEVEIVCDEMDRELYKRKYLDVLQKQFYPGVVVSHKTNTPVKYDREKEELLLVVRK